MSKKRRKDLFESVKVVHLPNLAICTDYAIYVMFIMAG